MEMGREAVVADCVEEAMGEMVVVTVSAVVFVIVNVNVIAIASAFLTIVLRAGLRLKMNGRGVSYVVVRFCV